MKSTPKVSVIIPNYNHAPFLVQRIDSVLNQTYPNFEVILMDDCSKDTSIDILEKYAQHPKVSNLLLNSQNSGSTFLQWKKGLEHAQGEYIWIAESDDYADPKFLEYLVPILEKGCALTYCRSFRVNDTVVDTTDYFWPDTLDQNKWRKDYLIDGNTEIANYLVYRNTIPNASACVFRKDKVSLDDDILRMKYGGDWLFWIRIIKDGTLGFSSKKLNYFRMHSNTTRKVIPLEKVKSKFAEYIQLVQEARNIASVGPISFSELKYYDWILKELMKMTNRKIYHPAIFVLPTPLLLRYYYLMSKHLFSF